MLFRNELFRSAQHGVDETSEITLYLQHAMFVCSNSKASGGCVPTINLDPLEENLQYEKTELLGN